MPLRVVRQVGADCKSNELASQVRLPFFLLVVLFFLLIALIALMLSFLIALALSFLNFDFRLDLPLLLDLHLAALAPLAILGTVLVLPSGHTSLSLSLACSSS